MRSMWFLVVCVGAVVTLGVATAAPTPCTPYLEQS
jgi:hypothetical protein